MTPEKQKELKAYIDNLVSEYKKDPHYKLKIELGGLLSRNIHSLNSHELDRLDVLKGILSPFAHIDN